MVKFTKKIEIDAPIERVFEFLTSPENLPEIWPSLIEVSNVRRQDDGNHSFDWVYKMAGLRFHGHSDTVDVTKNEHVVLKSESGIPNTFDYTYERVGGKTRVTETVEYAIPNRVLGKLAEPIIRRLNEREAELVLDNLKTRTEMAEKAAARAGAAQPAE